MLLRKIRSLVVNKVMVSRALIMLSNYNLELLCGGRCVVTPRAPSLEYWERGASLVLV